MDLVIDIIGVECGFVIFVDDESDIESKDFDVWVVCNIDCEMLR